MSSTTLATQPDRLETVGKTLTSVFASLESEQNLKKQIREALEPIEDVARASTTELNRLHSSGPAEHATICEHSLKTISGAAPLWVNVAGLIPAGEYYRYSFATGPVIRSLITNIAFAVFILRDELVDAATAGQMMGLTSQVASIELTAEDYLQGVIGMVNDLPRLSINSVTAQNFALPIRIAAFVNDIFASYSLLNLRNDALRRKFDSLKYDLKRCEDVVYDLTLRGLTPVPPAQANGSNGVVPQKRASPAKEEEDEGKRPIPR